HSNSLPLPPAPLSTGFTFSPANPLILQNVTFTAVASGGASPYAFSWDFGDGSIGSGQTATHNYTGIGRFTVTLETADSSAPHQTTFSSQTVLIGLTTPTNQSPSLQVPASVSVWAGTTLSFTVNATDTDDDSIALTLTGAPTGAAFSPSGAFVWRPSEDQAGRTWTLSFNATDNGSPALSIMKQVLVYVQPLWIDDTILQTSPNGNWHVNIATLPGGQVYAAYWIERHSMLGRLYSGGWGGEEQVSLSSTLTDVNSFIFASGNNLYAIYYDTSSESLYFASRSSNGAWIQSFIGFGEARLAGSQYSLPFTASVNQADPANPHFYVFWYNQTRQVIDEWSSTQSALGSQWLRTNATFSTQTASAGYSIGSFHYSAPVSGKSACGVIWIDGASSPYSLNFGLETVGSLSTPGTDSSWNPRVNCIASVVTIEQILGSQTSSLGGSVEGGSIYNPGITAPGEGEAKRWLTPGSTPQRWTQPGPGCTMVNADGQNVPAFVEIRGVQRGFLLNEDYSVRYDAVNGATPYPAGMNMSDTTFNIFTPGYGTCTSGNRTGCMHTIHVEIDQDWKAAGYCGTGTSSISRITINSTNLFTASVSLTATVSPSGPIATMTNSTVTVPPCNQCVISASMLNITTTPSNSGTYTITIQAIGGGLTSQVAVKMLVGGFNISASPPARTVPTGSSTQSTLTLTSLGGFNGTVNLSDLVSGCACGLQTSLSSSQVTLGSGGSATVTLSISTGTKTGNDVVIITGTSTTS